MPDSRCQEGECPQVAVLKGFHEMPADQLNAVAANEADQPPQVANTRAVFRCIACAAAFTPPTPPSQGGESRRRLSFSPPCEGGVGGVFRVPLHCARFVIHAIENRSNRVPVSVSWL